MSLKKWYSTRSPKATRGEDDEIEKIFELLEEGEEKIVLDENHKNPLYVLGNTGSGKSTLILFVSTDNSSLRSEETFPGSDEYIIVDDNETIGSGITSQTLFPELFIDDKAPAAYYDCPGFNDTRSPSKEIAASYFIKKVFDFADELKLILTVAYPSVRIGVERSDFMGLMKHSATLIKEIDKYQSSIALLVTKVDNEYKKVNGQIVLKPDEEMIDRIAQFMISVKEEIKLMVPGNEEEAEFHRRTIKFIDTLLRKDGGKYSRIGIFRRPDEAGPLCGVSLLQERKPAMKELLYKTLKFTKKNSADFGYTISANAKLHVNDMVDRIKVNVSAEIENVVKVLEKYDESVADEIYKIIESFAAVSDADTDEILARELTTKLTATFDAITKLKADVVQAKEIKEIAAAIEVCSKTLKVDTEAAVSNIMRQDNYFEFLQNVKEDLSIGDYSKSFDVIMVTLSASRKRIEKDTENMAKSVTDRVKLNLDDIVKNLETSCDKKFAAFGIQELTVKIDEQREIFAEFLVNIATIKSTDELSKEITKMVSTSEIKSIEIDASTLAVRNYGNYLTVLSIFKTGISVWSPDWIKSFNELNRISKKLEKSLSWYNFLQRFYTLLSSYEYLRNKERYNVANIDDWGKVGKPQGLVITRGNYKKLLEKINETNDETITEMDLDGMKLKELNNVPELTIKEKIQKQFYPPFLRPKGELLIEANFIQFSDILESNGTLKESLLHDARQCRIVVISAMDTIYVDVDLNIRGESFEVSIIAPHLELFGKKGTVNTNITGETLNYFERFLRQKFHHIFLKDALKGFLSELNSNPNEVYDIKTLHQNMVNFEFDVQDLYGILSHSDMIYLYRSIVRRTTEFMKNIRLSEITKEEKGKLFDIYVSALIFIYFLNGRTDVYSLILDVSGYRENVLINLRDKLRMLNDTKVIAGVQDLIEDKVLSPEDAKYIEILMEDQQTDSLLLHGRTDEGLAEFVAEPLMASNKASTSAIPFYVWSNKNNKQILSKLLAGEKVTLYTDIRHGNIDRYALRLRLYEVRVKATNEKLQSQLNSKLNSFKAHMKFVATAFHRIMGNVCLVHSACESHTIEHTFERTKDGNPVQVNEVYRKIKKGDMLISPFAMWEIQLTNVVNDGDFKELKQFKGKVDLELYGKWIYHVVPDSGVGLLHSRESLVAAEDFNQLQMLRTNLEETKSISAPPLTSAKRFYIWTNNAHKAMIADLLAGKKVTLYTDIQSSAVDKFDIKFNLCEINFKASDEKLQAQLNVKLNFFKAHLTYLGACYHRTVDQLYTVYNVLESQTIQHAFEKTTDGAPTKFNETYESIKNGDLMLSPFARWEMQLTNELNAGDFSGLKLFEDQVDVELVDRTFSW